MKREQHCMWAGRRAGRAQSHHRRMTVKQGWLTGCRKGAALACAALLAWAGRSPAEEKKAEGKPDLRAQIEAQAKEIAELQELVRQRAAPTPALGGSAATPVVIEEDSIKKIVAGYL